MILRLDFRYRGLVTSASRHVMLYRTAVKSLRSRGRAPPRGTLAGAVMIGGLWRR